MQFQKKSLAVAVSLAVTPLAALAAPSISWVTPQSGANMYGAYSETNVGCEISGTGISRAKFYVDGREMNSDYASPWRCVIDTRNFSLGTHTLKALAVGFDGTTTSITRSVNFVSSSTSTTTTNAAPSVSLTSPSSGQTVSGTIALNAIAADDKGVSKVVFMVDSTTIATDTSSPYSASLNTTTLTNGTHVLKAQAFDASGLSSTSQVSVNVSNTSTTTSGTTSTTTTSVSTPPPGTGALDVWFKAPLNGTTVSGQLSGTKCYVNGTGVVKVDFKVDGAVVGTDTTMSDGMQCAIDTTKYANGSHQLMATATSSTGTTRSDLITINISNSGTTTGGTTTGGTTTGGTTTGGTTTPTGSTTSPMPADSSGVRGVPTFHSIG